MLFYLSATLDSSSLGLLSTRTTAMEVRSWLATCSSSSCTATAADATVPLYRSSNCGTSRSSDSPSGTSTSSSSSSNSSSSSRETSSSSIESNLSLQTLPSVPSLQTLTTDSLHLSVSHHVLYTLSPPCLLPITCLAPHGKLLYAACGHEIHVYDASNASAGGEIFHIDAFNIRASSTGSVKSVAFCGGRVFTAHQDAKIRVWEAAPDGRQHGLAATLPTVGDRLRRFMLPKNYVTVRRHRKQLWIEHADAISALASNDGLVYSVSWDKTLKTWRGGSDSGSDLRCLESVRAHHDAVNAVVVATDGTVYTGSADRRIRVWARQTGEKRHSLVATLEKHRSAVNALALSGDGSVLFSGACDRSILVWEREDSANHMVVTGALRGHAKAILCLINISDLLLSGSADRTVRIWRRGAEGRYCCLAVLQGHRKPVKSLAAVSGGDGLVTVFSGSLDGEIQVRRVLVSSVDKGRFGSC
ncbi:protein JINGUBANG [Rhodamnia argentea]|uniref:Protein JINGUBANG n=1 Tax=Rhodamnia argentea TaxID=178133 RepID=A0ABM3GVH2_9MYRT|nr:protein JINGUBANG [Rhodamnia argentea]